MRVKRSDLQQDENCAWLLSPEHSECIDFGIDGRSNQSHVDLIERQNGVCVTLAVVYSADLASYDDNNNRPMCLYGIDASLWVSQAHLYE